MRGWPRDKVRHSFAAYGINSQKSFSLPTLPNPVFAAASPTFDSYKNSIDTLLKGSKPGAYEYVVNHEISPEIRMSIEANYPNVRFDNTGRRMMITVGQPNKRTWLSDDKFAILINSIPKWKAGEVHALPSNLSDEHTATLKKAYPNIVVNGRFIAIFGTVSAPQIPIPSVPKVEEKPKKEPEKPQETKKPVEKPKSVIAPVVEVEPPKKATPPVLPETGKTPFTPIIEHTLRGDKIAVAVQDAWNVSPGELREETVDSYGMCVPKKKGRAIPHPTRSNAEKDSYVFDSLDSWLMSMGGWVITKEGKNDYELTPLGESKAVTSKYGNKIATYLRPIELKKNRRGMSFDNEKVGATLEVGTVKFRRYGKYVLGIPDDKKWTDTKDIVVFSKSEAKMFLNSVEKQIVPDRPGGSQDGG